MSTPAPPGYSRPGLQQVLRADRALWLELAGRQPALTRSTANAPLANARCLDKAFEEASQTMDVNFHFMPLQQSQNPFEKGVRPPDGANGGMGRASSPRSGGVQTRGRAVGRADGKTRIPGKARERIRRALTSAKEKIRRVLIPIRGSTTAVAKQPLPCQRD